MSRFSGYLEKYNNLRQLIRHHGGIRGAFLQLFRTDELKIGDLIGVDEFGNKYYQNKKYFFGRSRWVYFSDENVGWDYDGSHIPPAWHRWLHYITDDPPSQTNLPQRKWMLPYTPNMSGSDKRYVPYTTTRPKIEVWKPPPGN